MAKNVMRGLTRRTLLSVAAAAVTTARLHAQAEGAPPTAAAGSLRRDSVLKTEDGREMRVSTWDASAKQRAVVLFSHGALSAPEKYERLIRPWNAAGFRVMAPLHVDSTDHPDHAKYGMIDSWRARLLDMRALAAFAGDSTFIAVGHSYGALVALTLGGAAATVPPGVTGPLRDLRVGSVVALSPPGAAPGLVSLEGYGALAVPSLIQTGDRDVPFGSTDGRWQPHLAAYEAAPAGDKYALVLQGVDHYFGGLICKFDAPGPPQPGQLATAAGLSTRFMEALALHLPRARALLDAALAETGPTILRRK